MSYLQFHLLFIVPPILLLAWTLRAPLAALGRRAGLGLVLISLVALLYTAPWDNYLVSQGIWKYGQGRVVGVIGYVPVEEYLFFLLQPLLAGLWLYRVLGGASETPARRPRLAARWGGALSWAFLGLAGLPMLLTDHGHYLGLILIWASPVLALQWAYGGHVLWRSGRPLLLGVAAPTIYLWLVDRVAIGLGIWGLSGEQTTGLAPLGLPVEEAVFFLITNLMVVQGLLLFLWISEGLAEGKSGRRASPEPEWAGGLFRGSKAGDVRRRRRGGRARS